MPVSWIRCLPALLGGAAIALLGVIHCAMGAVVLPPVLAQLPPADARPMAFMFVATGIAVLYLGGLQVGAVLLLARGARWARPVGLSAAGCALLLGIGAVAAMPGNPFAWIMLALAALALVAQIAMPAAPHDVKERVNV